MTSFGGRISFRDGYWWGIQHHYWISIMCVLLRKIMEKQGILTPGGNNVSFGIKSEEEADKVYELFGEIV